jgi:tetratricopeptide (TPR) repeat protein
MLWNYRVYEEPGILFGDRTVEADEPPFEKVEELMKPGFEEGRKLLAILTPAEGEPLLCPQEEHEDCSFEELAEVVTGMLGEGEAFAAAARCDAALRGAHAHDPELQLLAASIYEHIRFWDMAIPLLQKVAKAWTDLRKAAVEIRLARALKKSGRMEDVSDMLEQPLEHPELPPILKVEGMLLKAMCKDKEESLEILDELLDQAEETLGDHRLVADALELHADILSQDEPKKAEQYYLAAGKMLVQLQDPYFFSLNERFVVHFLRHEAYREALNLSHEMFELLKQAGGPPVAAVPYFVFASRAHKALGDTDQSLSATKTAHTINKVEAARLEQMLESMLKSPQER